MARTRTTKKLAQRIDLNYFKRPTASKRLKVWISVFVTLVALIWIAERGFSGFFCRGVLSRPGKAMPDVPSTASGFVFRNGLGRSMRKLP